MVKKAKSANVSGKPKHSLDANRANGKKKTTEGRSANTVNRLKMYKTRPKRNRRGKITSNEYQSKELPNTRIQPDRRWFGAFSFRIAYLISSDSCEIYFIGFICIFYIGNTRLVGQKELEFFREALRTKMSSNFNVILKARKLPMSLLTDNKKVKVFT